jgi:phospholipid/cholesterol/gamma-HCH transport system substrate-binding protein
VSDDKPLPPAPERRGIDREVMVGLFVIGGIAATVIALFTLTDAAMFRGRYVVSTILPNAAGIRKGDPVLMRGVSIGRVQRFDIDKDKVQIRLEVEGEYQIPKDSRVEIKGQGLLGSMVADVVPGQSNEFLRGGEIMPGGVGSGMFDKVNDLSASADKALGRVQALLSETTVRNIESGSTELDRVLKELNGLVGEQRGELKKLTANLRATSESLNKATGGPELEQSVKRMDTITKQLDEISASLSRSSKSAEAMVGRIDRGEGVLGKLSKDDALYVSTNEAMQSVSKAAQELAKLTEDLRRQPKRYLNLSLF